MKHLIVRLKLRPDTQTEDWTRASAVVRYARRAGFGGVIVSVPSIWDNAVAFEHGLVQWLAEHGKHGNYMTWCRDLHPAHTGRSINDIRRWCANPAYYGSAIAATKVEAAQLGMAASLDVELYGPDSNLFRAEVHSFDVLDAYRDAMERAVELAGKVELIFPFGGSQRPDQAYNINWCWDPLGDLYGTARTYGRTRWFTNVPQPPPNFRPLSKDDRNLAMGSRPSLTPEQGLSISIDQWRALDWFEITGTHHDQFAWIAESEYEAVLEAMAS